MANCCSLLRPCFSSIWVPPKSFLRVYFYDRGTAEWSNGLPRPFGYLYGYGSIPFTKEDSLP